MDEEKEVDPLLGAWTPWLVAKNLQALSSEEFEVRYGTTKESAMGIVGIFANVMAGAIVSPSDDTEAKVEDARSLHWRAFKKKWGMTPAEFNASL